MTDPLAGKYKSIYKREYLMALAVLGCTRKALTWSTNDYEAFVFKTELVHLIFYPHKTSAGNHHIRVRDSNSKDKRLANELMGRLDNSINNCTFSKNKRSLMP